MVDIGNIQNLSYEEHYHVAHGGKHTSLFLPCTRFLDASSQFKSAVYQSKIRLLMIYKQPIDRQPKDYKSIYGVRLSRDCSCSGMEFNIDSVSCAGETGELSASHLFVTSAHAKA